MKIKTSAQIKVTQDILGNLCVNGKRVGELINGLFRQTTDSMEYWARFSRCRFHAMMCEHGKQLEAEAILKAAGYEPIF